MALEGTRKCPYKPGAIAIREEGTYRYLVPLGEGSCVALAKPDSAISIGVKPAAMGADERCSGCRVAGICGAPERVVVG